jgi:RNA polymerase sigma factor (sigma-70 family)
VPAASSLHSLLHLAERGSMVPVYNHPVPNEMSSVGVSSVEMLEQSTGIVLERGSLEFEEFFAAEYERLLRAMYLLCRDRPEAEDLAQEAMARALKRWDTVRGSASPPAYVYKVALNLYRSALRRAAVAFRHALRDPRPDPGPDPSTDQRLAVLDMLKSLPRAQCEALVLADWLGFTSEEAARILGIKPESVRGRTHRARAALRERYGGMENE